MVQAKIIDLGRVRAGREALHGAFPDGPTRRRLLTALDMRHDHILFDLDQIGAEFGTDQPVQLLLQALGGGWSAEPDDFRPGLWVFRRHVSIEKARARIVG